VKSREPAYSQAHNQNKVDRQRLEVQRVRKADSQTSTVDGVWSRDGEGGMWKMMHQDRIC